MKTLYRAAPGHSATRLKAQGLQTGSELDGENTFAFSFWRHRHNSMHWRGKPFPRRQGRRTEACRPLRASLSDLQAAPFLRFVNGTMVPKRFRKSRRIVGGQGSTCQRVRLTLSLIALQGFGIGYKRGANWPQIWPADVTDGMCRVRFSGWRRRLRPACVDRSGA